MIFRSSKEARRVKLDSRYSVTDDGVVWSGEMPLEAIGGVGVNLHGNRVKIAYLVARAFVPNGECRQYVRHKNGDVRDNRAANLEWCDEKEERRRGRKPIERWVSAWDLEGERKGTWRSPSDAAREMGVPVRSVRDACNGKQKTAGGLLWRWGV